MNTLATDCLSVELSEFLRFKGEDRLRRRMAFVDCDFAIPRAGFLVLLKNKVMKHTKKLEQHPSMRSTSCISVNLYRFLDCYFDW